jgi:ABC-2 type transport system ATP-binding protein
MSVNGMALPMACDVALSRSGAAPMVRVRGLSKVFVHERRLSQVLRRANPGTTTAVDGVSLDIADGEVFGLVGPNGAGKTTLLRMLGTLIVPTAGQASVAGLDVRHDAAAVRQRIGMVASNERSFFWRLTGRQNLRFFADLYHLHTREAERWMGELLELLDLGGVADQRFESYSTGTKQRFAIARGLLHRPQVLFMDEPTKGVDPKSSADIIALIRDRVVSRARQTVIITTHNLREIEQLCQRTLIMEQGRVAYLGTTGDLKRTVMGTDAYRIQVQHLPPGLLHRLSTVCAMPVAECGPGVLDLRLASGGDSLERVMALLVEARCGVRDCSRVEIPIEDAFVAFLAGRNKGAATRSRSEEQSC